MSTRFVRSLKLKLFYGIPPPAKPVVSEPNKKGQSAVKTDCPCSGDSDQISRSSR